MQNFHILQQKNDGTLVGLYLYLHFIWFIMFNSLLSLFWPHKQSCSVVYFFSSEIKQSRQQQTKALLFYLTTSGFDNENKLSMYLIETDNCKNEI
jgi:hypothetical protein